MKRIISLILILILSLGVLSACNLFPTPTTPTQPTVAYKVEAARDYVRGMYTDFLDNNQTKRDFKLIASLMFYGAQYTVDWTVDSDAIKVNLSDDGLEATVDVPDTVEADLNYKLTGTVLAPDATSATIEFDLVVPAPEVDPVLDLMGNANLVSGSGEQNVFAANGVKFTNDKASSTSALTVQESYAQRAYAGSTIKIEYKGMRKIVITCDDYTPDGTKNYYTGMDGMVVEGATIIRKDAVITILFLDGPVDVFQSTSLASQLRIEKIEVFTSLTAEDIAMGENANGGNGGETSEYQAPAVDTAFKLFMEIGSMNYYFAGAMSGDYLATTTDVSASADIYFEVVDGGYHIYFMDGDTKTYINAAPYKKSNGYMGCHFELGSEPICVWTYNETFGIFEVYCEMDELDPDTFFAGTYGSYTTVSLSGSYYKAQITSGTQFPARIILSSEAGNQTHTHNFVGGQCACGEKDPNYVPPQADANALTSLKTGDKVYIVAHAYNMALSADKVSAGSYYNKGVDVSGGFAGLTNAEIWEVTVNADGSYTFTSLTGSTLALADQYSSFNDTGANKSWVLEEVSPGIYKVKNTVRGLYIEWYAEKNNWSAFGTANSDLFELSFYAYELAEGGEVTPPAHEHTFVEGKCECGETDPNYVPPVTEGPEALTSLNTGDKVYIVCPSHNMALSADKVSAGSYYNKGVDVSAGFDGLTDAETWEVTVNADGTYTFTSLTGSVLALADSYSSLNDTGANKYWTLEEVSAGLFKVKNTGRGNYLEWYNDKGNWSTYTNANSNLFELSFFLAK